MATKLSNTKTAVRTTIRSVAPKGGRTPTEASAKGGKAGVPAGRAPNFAAIPGALDLLPKDGRWWRPVEAAIGAVAELHQLHRIDPPALESAEMYEAVYATNEVPHVSHVGETRIVPQLDPRVAVLRAVLEHHVGSAASPLKLWYSGCSTGLPQGRQNTPLRGDAATMCTRVRGFEFIGDADPLYDGEAIAAAADVFRTLKLPDLKLVINTLGCRVCRASYQQKLTAYYRGSRSKLCRDCAKNLDSAPLALLGCTSEPCREERTNAPILLDYLCQNCNNHFRSVLEFVEESGVLYEPNPYLVGPAPYHTRTVFEFFGGISTALAGAPAVPLAAGGRYDYLGEVLHTKPVPAVGVTLYLERIIAAMKAQEATVPQLHRPAVFFIAVGDQARKSSLRLMQLLRAGGIPVAESVGKKSLHAQLKVAEKLRSTTTLLYGQREAFEGTVIVRDLKTGAQETVLAENLVHEMRRRMK